MVVTLKLLIMIAWFLPFAKVHLTDNVCLSHTTEPIEKGAPPASRVRQMTCIWMSGVSGLGNPTTPAQLPLSPPRNTAMMQTCLSGTLLLWLSLMDICDFETVFYPFIIIINKVLYNVCPFYLQQKAERSK